MPRNAENGVGQRSRGGRSHGHFRGGRGFARGRGMHRAGLHPDANDIGCQPGNPNNQLLPWVPSGLETVPHASLLGNSAALLANVTLPAFQRTPLRKCAIVVDRHVHKNGGSTVRDVFLEHERTGHALYQGYTQMYWHRDYRLLKRAADAAIADKRSPEHVLLIEAHFGWVEMEKVVLPSLRELSRTYKAGGVDCPVVLMTRVREPLEYYLSFYKWGVAFRQKEDPVRGAATRVHARMLRLAAEPPASPCALRTATRRPCLHARAHPPVRSVRVCSSSSSGRLR